MQQIGKDKRPPGPSRRSSGDVRGKPQLPKNEKRVIAPSLSSSDLSKLRVPPPPPTAASDRPLQDRLQLVRCVDDLLRLLSSALDRIDDVRCPQPASCSASLIHSRPPPRSRVTVAVVVEQKCNRLGVRRIALLPRAPFSGRPSEAKSGARSPRPVTPVRLRCVVVCVCVYVCVCVSVCVCVRVCV